MEIPKNTPRRMYFRLFRIVAILKVNIIKIDINIYP